MTNSLDPSFLPLQPLPKDPNSCFDLQTAESTEEKKPHVSSPNMQGWPRKMQVAESTNGTEYGSGQLVGRVSIQELLHHPASLHDGDFPANFQVPTQQGSYCWDEPQWQTLLMDAATCTAQHSLGRLTCAFNRNQSNNRSIILDGQQRLTTVTLLLASIRDVVWKRQQRVAFQGAADVAGRIDKILFPDQLDYRHWIHSSTNELREGIALPFAKLIPTYCDRWSYYSAILPCHLKNVRNRLDSSSSKARHRPLAAKLYFDAMLSTFSNDEIMRLYTAMTERVTMVFLPIDVRGTADGTEEFRVVYERSADDVTISGLDMIRNAFLGAFDHDDEAVKFYQTYWLPMERMASDAAAAAPAAATSSNTDVPGGGGQLHRQQHPYKGEASMLSSVMNEFFDNEFQSTEEEKVEEGMVGGLLYARFQLWQDTVAVTLDVQQQGEAMLAFAQGHFAEA